MSCRTGNTNTYYTVQLGDGNGGLPRKDVVITITGTNDSGEINSDTISIKEDVTLFGNVLDNDVPDPDFNEPLEVFSFTVDSDGDGVQDSYTAGDTVTITTSWGTIGTLTLNADGSYEFIPHPNYSGPVPPITYNAGNSTFSDNGTLNITVDPSQISHCYSRQRRL